MITGCFTNLVDDFCDSTAQLNRTSIFPWSRPSTYVRHPRPSNRHRQRQQNTPSDYSVQRIYED